MKAYEILSSPKKWTKGAHFKDEKNETTYDREHVTCMCLEGAVMLALDISPGVLYSSSQYQRIESTILRRYGTERMKSGSYNVVASFNDHPGTTFEEVVALLKELDL